ncbi:class I SAM-dependent methyltransferase [Desulfobacterota bacterium AH_259_B03_O07]|nr:class I SAM-dependent methyltransferase [Desulfobacterota bacterium AH_259_B03_O07]
MCISQNKTATNAAELTKINRSCVKKTYKKQRERIRKICEKDMNEKVVKERMANIINLFGKWTGHNIHLGNNIYTIDSKITGDEIKLRRISQIVSDVSGKSLNCLRILDLACLEGMYSVEFALHGAEVVAIEGRESSIEKAMFAKEVLGLNNIALVQDDVRNLTKEQYGSFDVVLCLGILYHLDVPDVFHLLDSISKVCKKILIIDTHISLTPETFYIHEGKSYWGNNSFEHEPNSTRKERLKKLWMSLDNPNSFIFTRRSLYNVLADFGFTSVFECHNPPEVAKTIDRVTLLAFKGRRTKILSAPLLNNLLDDRWLETMRIEIPFYIKIFGKLIPARIKNLLASYIRSRT